MNLENYLVNLETDLVAGDILECIDNGNITPLVVGRRYTFASYGSNGRGRICLNLDQIYGGWYTYRFKFVSRNGMDSTLVKKDIDYLQIAKDVSASD